MNTPILIAFGTNMNPEHNLLQGLAALHDAIGIHAISTVYRTRAVAGPDTPPDLRLPDFLNGALQLQGEQDPWELRDTLKQIEKKLGRQSGQPGWAPRPLDLDIALMGTLCLENERLTIPDPDIPWRPFLARPLAELAPTLRHPVLNQTLHTIAARFPPTDTEMAPVLPITVRLQNMLSL
ncbi:MAG: 2-amino-4-hydroxy-6-hydroxymethyldihydropteridine diphosphokinase [Magnetococcales bacterium]|nr:2-amino-4-hydroxy-6-hydroxymethyldihydropteridine diphosphokinase [Magnetococcales bacterium]